MTVVQQMPATVFLFKRRRYLTKDPAYREAAWEVLTWMAGCDEGPGGDDWCPCAMHNISNRDLRTGLVKRAASMLKEADRSC